MQLHLDPSSAEAHCYVPEDGHDLARCNNRRLDTDTIIITEIINYDRNRQLL